MLENLLRSLTDTTLKAKEAEDTEMHSADEILDDICTKVGKGSDWQKEQNVHDIIIKNITYENTGSPTDHESTGPLIHRRGVCDGISKLANLIFGRLGIESTIVYGELCMGKQNQGPHAWNQICIDGNWYHLDITEDLALSNDVRPYRYDYFNLSDQEISRDHKISSSKHTCSKSNSGYYDTVGLKVDNIREYSKILDRTLINEESGLTVKLPIWLEPIDARERLDRITLDAYAAFKKDSVTIESSMNTDQMVYHVSFL